MYMCNKCEGDEEEGVGFERDTRGKEKEGVYKGGDVPKSESGTQNLPPASSSAVAVAFTHRPKKYPSLAS